jgi:hypothetical protein
MAAPGFVAVSADGTFATIVLQWEGFTRVAWRAFCAVGYTTPPFYEGVEYEELGVPSYRVQVNVLPLSTHRPQEMLQTPLGLVPALNPNDPLWLGRMANIATLLETVPPYDTVQTLGTCLRTFVELSRMTWLVVSQELLGTSTGLSVSSPSCMLSTLRLCRLLLTFRVRYNSSRVRHTSF